MTGRINGVKRFEIHDGYGVRTTLFLKGCPLRCVWCHNPENVEYGKQLYFNEKKCTHCGICAKICRVHGVSPEAHEIAREACVFCGKCVSACPQNALGIYGEDVTAEEAVKILTEDRVFFAEGGVTLSGGEPLMQKDFSISVLRLLKKLGINTAVDTCLYAPQETLSEVALYTDMFLADLKTIDGALHKRLTGRENGIILNNFRYLSQINAPVEVRIPLVPPLNDGELPAMARFLSGLNNIKAVKVLPYHRMYLQKHVALGHEFSDKNMRVPAKEELERAKQTLRNAGLNVTEE